MRVLRSALLAALLCAAAAPIITVYIAAPGALRAQAVTGIVTGRVVGPDGNGLFPATVMVRGATPTATTDRDGVFRLTGVPLGRQMLLVRALGKKPAERAVDVAGDEPVVVNIAMELATAELSGIQVIGERSGQLRSALQKRRSNTISDVTSADEIGLLPDQNVAEAVQRTPGVYIETSRGEGRTVSIRGVAPNLNNVTLNGQQMATTSADRAQTLDLLPASMVSNIEVIKAVTPDMDANTIGGTVNLKTLSAFDRPRPFFFGIVEGLIPDRQIAYGPTTFPFEADFTAGRRFGVNETWGLVLSGSASRRDNAVSVLDPDGWVREENALTGNELIVSDEIEFQVGDNDRTRYSGTANLDWRPRPETNLFLRGLYTRTNEVERNSEFEITFTGDFEFPGDGRVGRNTASSMELDISRPDEREDMYSLHAGGTQKWGNVTLDLNGVATRGESNRTGFDATFENPRSTDAQAPVSLDFTQYFYGVDPENPAFVQDATNYLLRGLSRSDRFVIDRTFIGSADVRIDGSLGSAPAFLKLGGKLLSRDRDIDDTSDRFLNPTGITLASYNEPVVGGLQGTAVPFQQGAVDRFGDFVNPNFGGEILPQDMLNSQIQAIDGDAFVRERISAAYLMGQAEFGKLMLVGGVRMERTDSDAEFWQLEQNDALSGATSFDFPESRSTRSNSYTNVLPSAVATLQLRENLLLRGAYTSTIARPQFTQLARFTRTDFEEVEGEPGVFEGELNDNNPFLDPYTSQNVDLSLEFYPSTGGSLSLAYFGKRIDNPIFRFTTDLRDTTVDGRFYRDLEYSQDRNADAGTLNGVELGWSQPLYFLPGVFSGLGINANVAFVGSSLTVEGRDDELPFLGQPDNVLNIIPYFQRGPFEVRLAYARRSGFLVEVEEPGLDRFEDSRETFDLNLRWQLQGARWEILATARNLSNAPEVRYQGNVNQYDRHILTGRTFSLGLRTTR